MTKKLKRPRDPLELGKLIGDIATKIKQDLIVDKDKGKKLSSKQRLKITRQAVRNKKN